LRILAAFLLLASCTVRDDAPRILCADDSGCPANISQGGNSYVFTRNTGSAGTGISVGNTGGGQPVPVMPPFLALIYCKKM
jgi:hypothetical protein